MKKSFLVLAVVAATMIALTGCSRWDGNPITQNFSINGSYTELEVSHAIDVTVSDAVNEVVVTAGENIMPKVLVKREGETLKIGLTPLTTSHGSDIKVLLPYNASLSSVELSGASTFSTPYVVTGAKVEVSLSGASEFYGDIEANEVEMDLSGASSIIGTIVAANELELDFSGSSSATLEGQVGRLKVELSGSSDIKEKVVNGRYGLACGSCEGSMSGSSDAYIHCDGTIRVSLSGSSELHYTGNASTSGCSSSGGSNVVHDVL